uniref:Mitochondrial import receptor subunit TOM20 n=2 Tax=Lygus hesperus TaxID=30085 RepID=A0A0K8T1V5_LYGHE
MKIDLMSSHFEGMATKVKNNTTFATSLVFGAVFVMYCFYFDHKRRTDPNYRKRLKERRKARKQCAQRDDVQFPDLRDYDAVLMFLLQEVKKGEDALGRGDDSRGVEHLANAVAVCGQPYKFLMVLQETLTPDIFNRLLDRLPALSQKISDNPTGGLYAE